GCVVVKEGKVIAEGWHEKYGGDHAEIVALKKCPSARGATLYVNLEPCCHYGKTPPCVSEIISAGIARVVFALQDPNPKVRGHSARILRQNGIAVSSGCLENEARLLNEFFITYMTTGMPFVTVKAGVSLDGIISARRGTRTNITSKTSQKESHRLRAQYDAVLVGVNTVLIDNPHLGVRLVRGRDPLRIILDSRGKTPKNSAVMRDENCMIVKTGKKITSLLRKLAKCGVSSVLVEGGAEVIKSFLDAGCVDKVHLFIAPKLLGGGNAVPLFIEPVKSVLKLTRVAVNKRGRDVEITGYVR
ncbi:MAG: Riboflavin biosynthesis protein RibD, partial [Candidatus Peregrinibacteria bacterium GW2011_GWA2_44_7]